MVYKMFLGLCALLTVLMVDQADSVCCYPTPLCIGFNTNNQCKGRCQDGTSGSPYCGKGGCNIFGCNCYGGCRHSKRDVLEEVRSLLELLRGGQEDTAPEEGATTGRWFGDYDTDQDGKLSKQEALEMLKTLGQVDVAKLPADWFTSMDTNGNGFIDPEEYDKDVAKTMK
ncbi:uncharacterized protein LOC144880728 isoform X1 [Branchiostoma floridae x Branchiostoma japonicum]